MNELIWYLILPVVVLPVSVYLCVKLAVFAYYKGKRAGENDKKKQRQQERRFPTIF